MFKLVLLSVFYLISPLIIIYLCRRFVIFERIGTILLAYGAGLIIANIGILPSPSAAMMDTMVETTGLKLSEVMQLFSEGIITSKDVLFYKMRNLQDVFTMISIPLALPLLLFGSDIRAWSKMAGKAFLSMALALISVICVVISGYFLFRESIPENLWKISGMMVGLYSGGTPNLAAIKIMLDVDSETYIITHTYDTIVSAAYLFFLITIGKKFFKQVLPSYKGTKTDISSDEAEKVFNFEHSLRSRKGILTLSRALLFSVLIFAVSGGISMLFPSNAQMLVVILSITTLSVFIGSTPKIHITKDSFHLGMYFILVFSTVVASMADISSIGEISSSLFFLVVYAIFFSLFFHVVLSWIFKIDGDTVMVTSTALICSPPFVPMIAGAVHNKEVIVSGLTVGIVGYAIGNYLGVGIAYLLQAIG